MGPSCFTPTCICMADLRRCIVPTAAHRVVLNDRINPGKVFDLELPLEQGAEGYRAMDERRAIKALLRP